MVVMVVMMMMMTIVHLPFCYRMPQQRLRASVRYYLRVKQLPLDLSYSAKRQHSILFGEVPYSTLPSIYFLMPRSVSKKTNNRYQSTLVYLKVGIGAEGQIHHEEQLSAKHHH